MSNVQHGFVQIPILIAILVTAIFSGGIFVAYEITRPVQGISPRETTVESQTITSVEASTTINTEDKKSGPTKDSNSLIGSLKKQVAGLPQKVNQSKVETPKTSVATLPSGAVVEMDTNGNIIRYIQQPTLIPSGTPQTASGVSSSTPPTFSVQITKPEITTAVSTGKIEWETNVPTESKMFITGGSYFSQVYPSVSGLSTRHFVNLVGFSPKDDITYSYEIEAIAPSPTSNFAKETGTFKLLTRPYAQVLAEIKPSVALNPDSSCSQLFITPNEFLVCMYYKSSL